VAWFLRAVEQRDGQWRCQWGLHTFDVHDHLCEALAHLRVLAVTVAPAEVFIHRVDGTIQDVGPP
jgi:hypothetical protein